MAEPARPAPAHDDTDAFIAAVHEGIPFPARCRRSRDRRLARSFLFRRRAMGRFSAQRLLARAGPASRLADGRLRSARFPALNNDSSDCPAPNLFAGPGAPTDPGNTPIPPPSSDGAKGWVYRQSTGELTYNGQHVATGYSGAGIGKNDPDMQDVKNVGPVPQGQYSVGPQHYSPNVGPGAMNLTPLPGTDTYGRTLFRVHGDDILHPGQGSAGCIVLPPNIRSQLAHSPDHTLTVVR